MHNKARPLLLLAVAVASLGAAMAGDDPPAFWNFTCSAKVNYTDDSPYGKNLAELLSTLSTPPPATIDNWWFRSRTVGQASGLAMCFADSHPDRCLNCLAVVLPKYHALFPMCDHSRDVGLLGSDGCVIRYAGEPFLGSADSAARLVLRSTSFGDAVARNEARRVLLTRLAESSGGDARRFAAGSQGYADAVQGRWLVMYGMAQCTRDLPPGECAGCLVDNLAAMYRDGSVTNSTAASVMGFSCYLRYQVDEPIDIAGMAVPPEAPPSTAKPAPTGSAPDPPVSRTPLVVALAAAAAVTLFSGG